MPHRRKRRYPAVVEEYVRLATRAGWQASSIISGRDLLRQYHRWLRSRFRIGILEAGVNEFIEYRKHLLARPISREVVRHLLQNVSSYYLLKAQNGDGLRWLELHNHTLPLSRVKCGSTREQPYEPYSRETLRRILEAAHSYRRIKRRDGWGASEDYQVIMTLLYTGGRAQMYGLRVDEVDFEKMEIRTRVKGGVRVRIPLHPTLAGILRQHLATRKCRSDFVFQRGQDPATGEGYRSNRSHAWRICKRVQKVAGLTDPVHPHRFRKTLAVMARQLGLDISEVQRILGHRNVRTTMNLYATPDAEELRRAFASIDLTPWETGRVERPSLESGASGVLRAPPGTEHGWNLIVSGLQWLTAGGASASVPDGDSRHASGLSPGRAWPRIPGANP